MSYILHNLLSITVAKKINQSINVDLNYHLYDQIILTIAHWRLKFHDAVTSIQKLVLNTQNATKRDIKFKRSRNR